MSEVEALYARILSLVKPHELYLSCNGVLQHDISQLKHSIKGVLAAYAKVEEVRDAVSQLEQGKPPSGRSDKKVKKKPKSVKKISEKEASSSSESSSSNSSDESEDDQKQVEKNKTKGAEKVVENDGSELKLAHKCLKQIMMVKVENKAIVSESRKLWVSSVLCLRLLIERQSGRSAFSTDKPTANVAGKALEAAVAVLAMVNLNTQHGEEIQALIAVLSETCSKNEVLRAQFHWGRAQLESLVMGIPDTKRSKSPSSKKGCSQETEEMKDKLTSLLAQVTQWQDGIFALDQLDKVIKSVSEVMSHNTKDWNARADSRVHECVEKLERYAVHRLTADKKVKREPSDPDGWSPTEDELKSLKPFMLATEQSGCFMRVVMKYLGCVNLRPLKMHLTVADNGGDVYLIDRPYKCGGALCCPLEMRLNGMNGDYDEPTRIGRVREDFSPYLGRCCSSCCLATTYTDIERALPDGKYEKRYSLRTNLACCGRVNNCCAPSCCRNDAVYDILDPDGAVVANLQVSFGGGDCLRSCCRAGGGFTNYVLQFPRDSTPQDRALLLAVLFHLDYAVFEKK
ncbi:hypothetical protein BBJ29_007647 [Phytophthora kernoviae]|uniref:Phospholipid scramblase n=1 Tax=Phytophthora kernoviae TaxID=325452 RepID=A0A3F2RS55_9STRA|nr:hypothetical protein BBJ29_007647 [Phytophthora kernoviae]RLN63205.1 hypothetical protein BBP00_00004301 [Phytophthora kernoviae]